MGNKGCVQSQLILILALRGGISCPDRRFTSW